MNTPATHRAASDILVGMGQIAIAQSPQRLRAIVGSCIGLALYDPVNKAAVLAHVVLPESAGRDGAPGKFADSAVPRMLELFRKQGRLAHSLTATFAGGANMFNGSGPLQIGEANAVAVAAAVKKAGIRITGHDVGGTQGRRLEFDCTSGHMLVQCAGQPIRTL